MNMETVILNEKEYYVIEKIIIEEKEYYILINTTDNEDICIRKKIIEKEEEYLVGLESEKEFNLVMEEYKKKVDK